MDRSLTPVDRQRIRSRSFVHHPVLRRLLLAIAPLLLVLEIPGALELLRRPDLGWRLRKTTVMVVEPDGATFEAGVQVADRVLALGSDHVASYADVRAALVGHDVGERLVLTLERDGRPFTAEVLLERLPLESRLQDLAMRLSAACFLFLGFVTYLRRNDELGRTFYLTCILLALLFLDLPAVADRNWMRFMHGTRDGMQALLGAFLLRFLLIFPEGARARNRSYARERWILVPALVLLPLHVLSASSPASRAAMQTETLLLAATTLLFAAYAIAAVVVFVRKMRRGEAWVRGSKMRLATLGIAIGLLPLTVAALVRLVAPTHAWPLDDMAVLLVPLVPASFSLALLRSGVIDLAYLTRQILVALFLVLPLVLVAWLAAALLGPRVDPGARPWIYLLLVASIAGSILVARAPARSVARLIDRMFYPEQRRVRSVAERLGRELSEERDPETVARLFLEEMRTLLGSPRVLLLERDDARWRTTYGDGQQREDTDEDGGLDDDSSLVQLVTRAREVVVLKADSADGVPRFGPSARAWIRTHDPRVLAPLVVAGESIAILAIGPRDDGRDYGALHLYHVDSLCRQAAAALQNARLHQEDLVRERVRTEMELARQIQQQLLPQEPIEHEGVRVCGRTVSSRSVGGDLHDHFLLSDGSIVVVVADASGKGIPASLLTSGLRTAVRETVRPGLPLAEAVAHINRHVHGMTDVGHFIALFCAVVDPHDGMVEYCVAGIEPPLWVRASLGRAEWLTRGGPVLGVDPDAGYRVGTIRLEAGDALVAYSDGLIDEENEAGDAFGNERLVSLLAEANDQAPDALLERIFERVQTFAAGEAVDDTTVVVLRRRAADAGTDRAAFAS